MLGFTRDLKYPLFDDYMQIRHEAQRWGSAVIEFENGAVCWFEKPVLGGSGRQFWDVEGSEGNLTPDGLQRGKAQPEILAFQSAYIQVEGVKVLDRLWIDSDPVVEYRNPYASYGIGREEDLDEVARADILVRFHEAIVEDRPVAYPVERAWPDQELAIAVEESQHRGNQWVTLPLDGDGAVEAAMHAAYRKLYGHDPEDVDALIGAPMPRGGVRCEILGDM